MAQRNKTRSKKTQTKRATTAYAVRKERKQNLEEQAEQLQSELDSLKLLVLVNEGEIDKATRRSQLENVVLHEFVQEQHLPFAQTQAAFASHVQRSLGFIQPGQSVIRLGIDQAERYKTLIALKDRKLDYGERYLAARSHGFDLASTYCQEERFDAPDGDYSVVKFEILPIHGVRVVEVFDAILNSILNAEIVLSEVFGSLSVREDSDFESSEFAQIRLASAVSSGSIVESNTVVFPRFHDGAGSEHDAYGIIAANYVDFDELHPYQTGKRVRGDTTSIITTRSLSGETKEADRDSTRRSDVVVTRWTCLQIHRSDTNILQDPEVEMKESSVCWGDTTRRCVEQQLVQASTTEVE
ncbi:hypothetical protein KRP22_002153 [Phytophthora ramorum]|nr:hypothetical protein KRP22_1436 [Phytophthora ramorum]